MAEPVAKKKRQRRKASDALLKITVERIETSQSNPPIAGVEGSFVPLPNHVVVLEQSMPESKFDLAKVIKAINGL